MTLLRYGVKVETGKSLQIVEGWLEEHCSGEWRIDFDGLSNDMRRKRVAVFFQTEEDKKRFKDNYGRI